MELEDKLKAIAAEIKELNTDVVIHVITGQVFIDTGDYSLVKCTHLDEYTKIEKRLDYYKDLTQEQRDILHHGYTQITLKD